MIVAGIALGLLLALPMFLILIGDGGLRPWNISVWNPENKKVTGPAVLHALGSLLSLINPRFLFLTGDANARHNMPGFGQALHMALPFLLVALALAFRAGPHRRALRLTWAAFLIGLTPAVLTADGHNPHALRSLSAAPFLDLLTAAGIVALVRKFIKDDDTSIPMRARVVSGALVLLFTLNALLYFVLYFGPYRVLSEKPFFYGAKTAIAAALERRDEFDLTLVTPLLYHAHLLGLFLDRTDPRRLHSPDYRPYIFQFERGQGPPPARRILVIQRRDELGVPVARVISGTDGTPYFTLGEVVQ